MVYVFRRRKVQVLNMNFNAAIKLWKIQFLNENTIIKQKKRKVNDQIVEFVYRIEIMNRRPMGLTTNPAYNFGLLLGHLENVGYPVAPDFFGLGFGFYWAIFKYLFLQFFILFLFFNITNDIFYIKGKGMILVSRWYNNNVVQIRLNENRT